MSDETRLELGRASGGELSPRRAGLSKMHALHSSSVLACNFFEPWRGTDLTCLLRALGASFDHGRMAFEERCPTGLPGDPPQLDVAILWDHGDLFAIESKFTEPFGAARAGVPFKAKYFPEGRPLWSTRGLERCGDLAAAMQRGETTFQHLDAAQLLKHCLGLHARGGGRFTLAYLFVDIRGEEGKAHLREVDGFGAALGDEVSFVAMSYAALLGRLAAQAPGRENAHHAYLTTRYVSESSGA